MAIPFLNHLDLRSVSELQNAILHKTTEASASNVEGKIIYDTGTDSVKFYNGSSWVNLDGAGDISQITTANGSALSGGGSSGNISLQVVVGDPLEILSNTITVKETGITNAMLAGSISNSKLAGSITGDKISNDAIDSQHYADGSIDTAHIADQQVTFAKMQQIQANSFLGRVSGSGQINNISAGNARTILNVEDGAQANVATDLGKTTAAGQITITSSTGTDVVIGEATDTIAGLMSTTHHDKLDGIESGATGDQTNAEIRAAVEAASDSNVFTDADHSKLNGIAASANNYSASKADLISVGATLDGDDTLVFGDSGEDTQVTIKGNLTVTGTQTVNNVVTVSTSNGVQFEGTAADGHDAVLKSNVASSDKTYTLPNLTGHIPLLAAEATATISATPAELNLLDGDTSVGSTGVASGDGFIHNDNGTMRVTSVDKLAARFAGTNISASNAQLSVSNASTSNKGVVEIATTAEATSGSDSSRAVTPAGLKQFDDDRKHVSAITSAISAGASHTITHSLGTRDIIVQIFAMVTDLTTSGTDIVDQYAEVKLDVIRATTDTITITPNIAIRAVSGTGSLRVLIKALD